MVENSVNGISDPELDAEFKQGVDMLQNGKMEEAKALFQKLLSEHTGHDALCTTLAAIAVEQQEMNAAIEFCSIVLNRDPGHPIARDILAEVNIRLAEDWQSEEQFAALATAVEDAVSLTPQNQEILSRGRQALHNFAKHLKDGGKSEEAAHYVGKADTLGQEAA